MYHRIKTIKYVLNQGTETHMEQPYEHNIKFPSATKNIVPKTLSKKSFVSTKRYDLTIISQIA